MNSRRLESREAKMSQLSLSSEGSFDSPPEKAIFTSRILEVIVS